jgi:CRISPR type III-A-associated protein Csm2
MNPNEATGIVAVVAHDNPKALDEQARALAGKLRADEASKTQVRRLYGTMKQIEMSWPRDTRDPNPEKQRQKEKDRDDAYRELILLKPRLAYQGQRHLQLLPLVAMLQDGIDQVGKDRERLKRLVQFFEATVGYYVAEPPPEGRR